MATLEKIRSQAGLLVVIVGLALFAFIIGDFLNSGSTYFRQSQDQVAVINGKVINYLEYQSRIEELTNIYKMQSNTGNLQDEQLTQIRQNVYDALVHEIVLNEALTKLGITVTPEELFDMVQGENISPMVQQFPMFTDPETGAYSKARALNFLKTIEDYENVPPEYRGEIEQARSYWLFWERNLKQQRMQEKYMSLLSKAIVANPLDAKDAYESSLESSDILYAMQSFATIPDSAVTISDRDIKQLYNQRKEQFKQKESRILDYISVDIRPSEDDYAKVHEDALKVLAEMEGAERIEDIVNANSEIPFQNVFASASELDTDRQLFVETAAIGDFEGPVFRDDSYRIFKLLEKTVAPDSVRASHILLPYQNDNQETIDALADSLLNVLKAGGDFEMLAYQYSIDQQSAQIGGEIGWLTESVAFRYFGEEFKDAIFSAPVNRPTLHKATYGVHILNIAERTANVPKYKLAYVLLSVTPSTKTYTTLYNALNQFISANYTAEKITAAASGAGYILNENSRVTVDDRFIGAVYDSRSAIRWAFESTKKGEVSRIFEFKNHFMVAIRKDALPEGYQSIQYVAPLLRNEMVSEAKGAEIVKELKAGDFRSIDAYAEAMKARVDTVRYIDFATPRITGIGMEPKLNAHITFAPLHTLSEPIAGNNGVYVFNVFNRTKQSSEYEEQAEILKLEGNNMYRVSYSSIQSLIGKAKITDNRIRFD
jgi:peptidyl-prolyl cis-trans isomerase D